jgi:hypothetical protein
VFDEQHCAAGVAADCTNLFPEALDLGVVESRRRFVEKQQRRWINHRACELDHPRDADREGARKFRSRSEESTAIEHFFDALTALAFSPPTGREIREVSHEASTTATPFQGSEHVVLDRESTKGLHSLKGSPESTPGAFGCRHPREIDAAEPNTAVVRRSHARDDVEQRCLSGTVRPDDAEHLALVHVERDVVECGDATEPNRDAEQGKDCDAAISRDGVVVHDLGGHS